MATKRIKDISTTATTFAADDFIALDASSVGTRKMAKASLITQVGANYLEKADNLSDVASKDTSKLNLEVPNVGTAANEVPVNGMLGTMAFQSADGVVVDDLTVDGQLTAAVGKPMPVNGPSMRFDGSNDFVSFAAPVGSAFSFTNSTDDTPFSVSAWVKLEDATSGTIISKFGSSASDREYRLYIDGSDLLTFDIRNTSGDSTRVYATTAMTGLESQWIHIAATYAGSGPNSATAFASAADVMSLYINGKSVALTKTNNSSYDGMSSTNGAAVIGRRFGADYFEGEIRDVKLSNKELSAAEVREVYSNGQLPESFAESTGTAALNTVAFVSSPYASNQFGTVTGASTTGFTAAYDTGNSTNRIGSTLSLSTSIGKRYKITFNANTGGQAVRLQAYSGTFGGTQEMSSYFSSSTLTSFEYTVVATATSEIIGFFVAPSSAGNLVVSDFRIIQIGSVLDARAEQFDSSTGKLYDLSGNDFVGTQSGGVSVLGREFPVFQTGTWTPSVSFGGGSAGITYLEQAGQYTRIGDVCFVRGIVFLSNKGSDGGALKLLGLPLTSSAVGSPTSILNVLMSSASALTSQPTGIVDDGGTGVTLMDYGATGIADLTEANITNSTIIRISGTYQIQ